MNIIYKVTNKTNGKVYIGSTTKTLKWRWAMHVKYGKGVLKRAIRKYGAHNFTVEELCCVLNLEDLHVVEARLVLFYNSLSPAGYNLLTPSKNEIPTSSKYKKQCSERLSLRHSCPEEHERLMVGVRAYVERKKRKILAVDIRDGHTILRFDTVCAGESLDPSLHSCLASKSDYSQNYCWFYDEGQSDEWFIEEALRRVRFWRKYEIYPFVATHKETGEVIRFNNIREVSPKFNPIQVKLALRKEIKSSLGFTFNYA